MIVVTGGAGFIGYNLVKKLIETGHKEIVVIDNGWDNIQRFQIRAVKDILVGFDKVECMTVEDSFLWLGMNVSKIKHVIHLGARTDTTEKNEKIFNELNIRYSKFIWSFCAKNNIPLIYASSAAVYGDGRLGFNDDTVEQYLTPLNPYGWSKLLFDDWVSVQDETPPHWAGLRFFNVYGPYEEHKDRMASVVWHFYNQIKETDKVNLFKSHKEDCEHGEQKRDFIYVQDIVDAIFWFMSKTPFGIYNLGTGKARSYNDLAKAIFKSLGKEENIQYIDMPEDIRDSYQYFTEANLRNLRSTGYNKVFTSLESGIDKYIKLLENENC